MLYQLMMLYQTKISPSISLVWLAVIPNESSSFFTRDHCTSYWLLQQTKALTTLWQITGCEIWITNISQKMPWLVTKTHVDTFSSWLILWKHTLWQISQTCGEIRSHDCRATCDNSCDNFPRIANTVFLNYIDGIHFISVLTYCQQHDTKCQMTYLCNW